MGRSKVGAATVAAASAALKATITSFSARLGAKDFDPQMRGKILILFEMKRGKPWF